MDLMTGLSSIVNIVSFVIFGAGVVKVFQMATMLTEIKAQLTAIQLNGPVRSSVGSSIAAPAAPPAPLPSTQSGEQMLRALSLELDHPVNPASVELGNKS